jgi:hypothetical protein
MRRFLGVVPALLLALAAGRAADQPNKNKNDDLEKTRSHLLAHWKEQAKEIVTAEFKLRTFQLSDDLPCTITRDQLCQLLKNLPNKHLDDFTKMREQFPKGTWRTNDWPETVLVYVDGSSLCNEQKGFKDVCHGGVEIHSRRNTQIDLLAGRTGIRMIELRNLRFVPYVFPDKGDDQLAFIGGDKAACKVKLVAEEMSVDTETGFVHHWVSKRNNEGFHVERFQYSPTKYPGDVLLPKVVVEANFAENRLELLFIHYIEDATLNKEVDCAHFAVSAPAGATVVDLRGGPGKPKVSHPPNDVPDVVRYVDYSGKRKRGRE